MREIVIFFALIILNLSLYAQKDTVVLRELNAKYINNELIHYYYDNPYSGILKYSSYQEFGNDIQCFDIIKLGKEMGRNCYENQMLSSISKNTENGFEGEEYYINTNNVKTKFVYNNTSNMMNLQQFYETGEKKHQGSSMDDIKMGQWVYFNKNGDTLLTINYDTGLPLISYEDKKYIKLSDLKRDSTKVQSTYYRDNKLFTGLARDKLKERILFIEEGEYKFELVYDKATGNKKIFHEYRNGILDGLTIEFYPNGNQKLMGFYSEGSRDGMYWNFFNEKGQYVDTKQM